MGRVVRRAAHVSDRVDRSASRLRCYRSPFSCAGVFRASAQSDRLSAAGPGADRPTGVAAWRAAAIMEQEPERWTTAGQFEDDMLATLRKLLNPLGAVVDACSATSGPTSCIEEKALERYFICPQ